MENLRTLSELFKVSEEEIIVHLIDTYIGFGFSVEKMAEIELNSINKVFRLLDNKLDEVSRCDCNQD